MVYVLPRCGLSQHEEPGRGGENVPEESGCSGEREERTHGTKQPAPGRTQ